MDGTLFFSASYSHINNSASYPYWFAWESRKYGILANVILDFHPAFIA